MGRMKPNILFILIVFIIEASESVSEYEYDYDSAVESEPTGVSKFFYEDDNEIIEEEYNNHEPSEYYYDDPLPYDELLDADTLTIEQFVNELKRRKQAKEQQKKKTNGKTLTSKGNKATKKNVTAKKEKSKVSRGSKVSSSRPNKSNSPRKRPSKTRGTRKPKNTKTSKGANLSKIKTKPGNKPSIKNKVKAKPTRKQKPFHKPKKDQEEEDFFQIGTSEAQEHSDHHIHHHDHLEAHKHHHKHKESHSHAHEHSNDHEHNHKHTHNHVHNHIHKHNEAHEHTAEHSHTEKHHHKHLEYIDAGGWRRRNDEYNEMMLEDEPSALIMENRDLEEDSDPKKNLKGYLKKFIQFYKNAASSEDMDDITTPEEANQNNIDSTQTMQPFKGFTDDIPPQDEFNADIDNQYDDYHVGYNNKYPEDINNGEDYADYNDQLGYGSTSNVVMVAYNNLENNDDDITLELSDENQWQPQSDIVMERSDEGFRNYKNSGSKGQTYNEEDKTVSTSAEENKRQGRSLFQDISFADYEQHHLGINTLDIKENVEDGNMQAIDTYHGIFPDGSKNIILNVLKVPKVDRTWKSYQ